MTMFRTLLTASILATSIGAAQAQTPPAAGTDPHHPAAATGAAAPALPAAPTASLMPPGAAGAPGTGAMMGGDMGKMMQSMMPMMRMMMMRGGMEQMDGPMGMMAPQRIEGRIAFLKTELKITDAQLPQWNAFADVLRKNAKGMMEMRGAMMQAPAQTSALAQTSAPAQTSALDRADQHIKMMTAGLEAAKASAAATRALYAALTDTQKATADELLAPPMGRM